MGVVADHAKLAITTAGRMGFVILYVAGLVVAFVADVRDVLVQIAWEAGIVGVVTGETFTLFVGRMAFAAVILFFMASETRLFSFGEKKSPVPAEMRLAAFPSVGDGCPEMIVVKRVGVIVGVL